jgi:hypothetical protein
VRGLTRLGSNPFLEAASGTDSSIQAWAIHGGFDRRVDSPALNPEAAQRVNWPRAAAWRPAVPSIASHRPLVAIFSMLCTRQTSCHCVATLLLPRSVKRLMRLWCRRLA